MNTEWALARAIGINVFQFETRTWPRIKFEKEPPGRLTELEKNIFRAFKVGIRVPNTAQSIFDANKLNTP